MAAKVKGYRAYSFILPERMVNRLRDLAYGLSRQTRRTITVSQIVHAALVKYVVGSQRFARRGRPGLLQRRSPRKEKSPESGT